MWPDNDATFIKQKRRLTSFESHWSRVGSAVGSCEAGREPESSSFELPERASRACRGETLIEAEDMLQSVAEVLPARRNIRNLHKQKEQSGLGYTR
jgi:hypothetical protein